MKKSTSKNFSLADLSGAVKSKMPEKFLPELASLVKNTPLGTDWLYEIKYDGYRILSFFNDGKVKLITRNGHDWTEKFSLLSSALQKIPVKSAILDGELVALNSKGISEFQLLQDSLESSTKTHLAYCIFDIPYYEGYDLSHVPLLQRKELLKQILAEKPLSKIIVYSADFTGTPKSLLTKACKRGMEGLIAKKAQSYYYNKRTEDWIKLKCFHRQEFVIGGYTNPQGSRKYFGSLLIGYYDEHKHLHYAGRVGTGFTEQKLKHIYDKMQAVESTETPFYQLPKLPEVKNAHWLKPVLVGEVQFTEWTNDELIRHPSFKGLREDKAAFQVHQEIPS